MSPGGNLDFKHCEIVLCGHRDLRAISYSGDNRQRQPRLCSCRIGVPPRELHREMEDYELCSVFRPSFPVFFSGAGLPILFKYHKP